MLGSSYRLLQAALPVDLPPPPTDSEEESEDDEKRVSDDLTPAAHTDEVFLSGFNFVVRKFIDLQMDVDKTDTASSTESRAGSGSVPNELHFRKKLKVRSASCN